MPEGFVRRGGRMVPANQGVAGPIGGVPPPPNPQWLPTPAPSNPVYPTGPAGLPPAVAVGTRLGADSAVSIDNLLVNRVIWLQPGGVTNITTGAIGGFMGGAVIGGTPPAAPYAGALWWDSNDGQLYTYYDDGNSQQWVVANTMYGLTQDEADARYITQSEGDGRYLQLSGGTMSGDIAPYFGTGSTVAPIDLITSQPASGIYQTAGASNIQAEPILGPFMGKDFTRAQSVSYLTTTLGSDVGEYAHLFNLKAQTGYPSAWQASHAYLLHDTVTNGGNFYSVTTAGTSAASGGPTGTGSSITDGTVVWAYQASNQATNGGKVNLGVFSYADVNAGHTWGIANDLQISAGTNKVAAFAQEIDLNNFRMDYNTGVPGPAAVALQIFAGGPNRSSYAIGIAAQSTPTDPANFVYGMLMQGSKLVSNIDVWLSTGANIGLQVDGTRAGTNSTAFYAADNSQNAIIVGGNHSVQDIWITDSAPTVLTVGGTHTNVVNITGTISGVVWNGPFSATSINSTPIGNTTPSTGAFTTLSSSGAVSGTGFTSLLAPYAPLASPTFTGTVTTANLTTAGTVSGVGFSNYLASPPVIGGTAPAAGTFTNLAANGLTTGSTPIISVTPNNVNAVALQFGGTSQNSIYCNDTSQHGIIFGGTHSNSDIWVLDSCPTFALIQGTHTSIIDVTGATVSGLAWSGNLSATAFVVSAAAGPTIRAGTGAATGTQPAGSLWLRTDGAVGSRLYVSAGGGTWAAVSGV